MGDPMLTGLAADTDEGAVRVSGPINEAGLEMTLETGKLARLADGAVIVKVGGTTILSTVCTSKPREGIDFFPLTVDVEERMYAAGKIPGSFFRREGRPGEQAILTARLTDRPLRPSFPDDFRNEVQVIATILGVDLENPHDVASINADGLEESKRWIKASIELQLQLREAYEKARGPIEPIDYLPAVDYAPEIYEAVREHAEADTAAAMAIADKTERNTRLAEIEALTLAHLVGTVDAPARYPESNTAVKRAFRSLQKEVTRRRIVNDG